ncbi:MAG: hypothetical protein KTR14_03860 [Vampirovibrio sp.]|nr:hypothetical protein [Vampirovibrio sp.]
MMKKSMMCVLQQRFGAMDRVLGALTHRGVMPDQLSASVDPNTGHLVFWFTFNMADEKAATKLLKSIQNQVFVLDASYVTLDVEGGYESTYDEHSDDAGETTGTVTPIFARSQHEKAPDVKAATI